MYVCVCAYGYIIRSLRCYKAAALRNLHIYIHAYINTNVGSTSLRCCKAAALRNLHAYIQRIHTYTHAYITYIHTYIHTYIIRSLRCCKAAAHRNQAKCDMVIF
jgi:hypothetical protein